MRRVAVRACALRLSTPVNTHFDNSRHFEIPRTFFGLKVLYAANRPKPVPAAGLETPQHIEAIRIPIFFLFSVKVFRKSEKSRKSPILKIKVRRMQTKPFNGPAIVFSTPVARPEAVQEAWSRYRHLAVHRARYIANTRRFQAENTRKV